MNKLKLIEMIKQLIKLQKEGNLTAKNYQTVEENTSSPSLNNDLVSYKETELICFLFKEIPYYQILPFLNDVCMKLSIIKKENKKLERTIILIEAYFSDLLKNITARIETEVTVHIYWIIQSYYQNNFLNPEKIISMLKRNSCNPESLTGMFTAENIHYEQVLITGFVAEKEELRETISRTNYKRRSSVENKVQKTITKFFENKSFDNLLIELRKCFDYYRQQNERDCEILEEEIMIRLKEFYQKAQRSWKENKTKRKNEEDDSFQLSLNF